MATFLRFLKQPPPNIVPSETTPATRLIGSVHQNNNISMVSLSCKTWIVHRPIFYSGETTTILLCELVLHLPQELAASLPSEAVSLRLVEDFPIPAGNANPARHSKTTPFVSPDATHRTKGGSSFFDAILLQNYRCWFIHLSFHLFFLGVPLVWRLK